MEEGGQELEQGSTLGDKECSDHLHHGGTQEVYQRNCGVCCQDDRNAGESGRQVHNKTIILRIVPPTQGTNPIRLLADRGAKEEVHRGFFL